MKCSFFQFVLFFFFFYSRANLLWKRGAKQELHVMRAHAGTDMTVPVQAPCALRWNVIAVRVETTWRPRRWQQHGALWETVQRFSTSTQPRFFPSAGTRWWRHPRWPWPRHVVQVTTCELRSDENTTKQHPNTRVAANMCNHRSGCRRLSHDCVATIVPKLETAHSQWAWKTSAICCTRSAI